MAGYVDRHICGVEDGQQLVVGVLPVLSLGWRQVPRHRLARAVRVAQELELVAVDDVALVEPRVRR